MLGSRVVADTARSEAQRRLAASASLDSIAIFASGVTLVAICLLGITLGGHEWARGTAMAHGHPITAVVSLSRVRYGSVTAAAGSEMSTPVLLHSLCGGSHAHMPPHVEMVQDTPAAVWCALERAGGLTKALLWFGYLPLWLAFVFCLVLGFSNRWNWAKTARYTLAGYGLDDSVLNLCILSSWLLAWALLFAGLASYAYSVPGSLGWGHVSLEASFGVLQLAFIVLTLTGTLLTAKMFAFWDEESLKEAAGDLLDASPARKGTYAVLCAQLLLYLLCAVHALEWQALICLFGLYYLDTDRINFLVVFATLTSISLFFDVTRVGAMPPWGQMTGAEGFANSCYVAAAAAKILALTGLALVRRDDVQKRLTSPSSAAGTVGYSLPFQAGSPVGGQ
mmetsp:Transcript_28523/g.83711  ORF Transcript_28523/g.83711 Transcript_28523/m.83711 type:complete len:394 (+) Transcript_28523:19-1200(+)